MSAKAEPRRVLDLQRFDIARVLRSVWRHAVSEKFAAGCTVTSIWRPWSKRCLSLVTKLALRVRAESDAEAIASRMKKANEGSTTTDLKGSGMVAALVCNARARDRLERRAAGVRGSPIHGGHTRRATTGGWQQGRAVSHSRRPCPKSLASGRQRTGRERRPFTAPAIARCRWRERRHRLPLGSDGCFASQRPLRSSLLTESTTRSDRERHFARDRRNSAGSGLAQRLLYIVMMPSVPGRSAV